MDLDLTGQVVAVTGASSGIGEAVARRCAAAGAKVSLAARREDRIAALAEEIGGLAVPTDIGEEDQAQAFVAQTREQFGRLDALVNNAGVMLLGPVANAPTEEWRRMLHVNVFGVLYATHAALPHMLEQGSGTIVNVSSVAGRFARPGSGVYALTKFGVGAFSESLRQEVAESGVRVVLIEPGAVTTELAEQNRPEVLDGLKHMLENMQFLDADDIARGVLYALAQPPGVSVNELLIRPTSQAR